MHAGKSYALNKVLHAARHDHFGAPSRQPSRSPDHAPQRRQIEVVHVGMGQEDEIDRWQAFDQYPGTTLPAQ